MSVVARIQAHPARNHLHASLADSLGLPTEILVHESDPPSPWAGYQRCLTNIPSCSHLLIVQDDAQVSANFAQAVEQIAQAWPDVPVCLFLGGFPQNTSARALRASLKGERYISLHIAPIMPVVAVLWPREKAQEFLEWALAHPHSIPGGRTARADDGVAAAWMRNTRQQVMVTVPSIVQHCDEVESVKGGAQKAAWGHDRLRVAKLFAEDASTYDWTRR